MVAEPQCGVVGRTQDAGVRHVWPGDVKRDRARMVNFVCVRERLRECVDGGSVGGHGWNGR